MSEPAIHEDIIATVAEIAAMELGVPTSLLTPESDLHQMVGADSVKVVRMIARVEQIYRIELADEVVFSLRTVANTADAIVAALREQT
jgi:acyl carrier protein